MYGLSVLVKVVYKLVDKLPLGIVLNNSVGGNLSSLTTMKVKHSIYLGLVTLLYTAERLLK